MTETATSAAADEAVGELVKTIDLDHPIERVWRAVTDPAEVGLWFANKYAQWDVEPGSVGTMVWHGTDGGPDHTTEVRIEKVQPPSRFAYTWGEVASTTEPLTLVEYTLAETATGGTQLTVRESGFRTAQHRDGNDGGWDAELAELVAYLTGSPTP